MPPRGSEGLDFTPILTHYVFLFTTILAVFSWFIAFISQCIVEAQTDGNDAGTLWFAIFLQLALIAGVIYTLASDSIAMNRFQISVFGAIAVVFSILGANAGIFGNTAARQAMGAGWFILAIVNIVWVLYFTAEEDSLCLHLFNFAGTGGLTPPSRRRRTRTQSSMHNLSANNGYAANYASGGGIGSHDIPYNSPKLGGGIGSGVGSGIGSGTVARSQHSFNSGDGVNRSMGGAGSINDATPITGPPRSLGGGETNGPSSPLMAGVGAGPGPAPAAEPAPESYSYKAKALYAYTASPEDPNEISFTKGEILDIVDKNGKWWQAKKADGSVGIAPSNYLQII